MIRPRRHLAWPAGAVVWALVACGEPPPEVPAAPPVPDEDQAVAPPVDSAFDFTALVDFRSLDPAAAGDAGERFRHTPHAQVACRTCHASPAGHGAHADLDCAECHGTQGAGVPVSPAECMACHHAAERRDECMRCHEPGALPDLGVRQSMRLSATGTAVPRELDFSHARHAAPSCTACHDRPEVFDRPGGCAGCHQDHHGATADCGACHEPPAPGVHDRQAHRGCAGSGCHVEAGVLGLTPTRSVCLACHPAQVDHEPRGACADCHTHLPFSPGAVP